MAIYSFVRNGQTFKISGPSGSTEAQALAVLDAQLLSGTLVGQSPGTEIDLKSQVANGLNLVGVQLEGTTVEAVDQLPKSLPADAIGIEDFKAQKPGEPVGTLDGEQVRALLAQRAKSVGQELTAVSNDKGIGRYGLNLAQLEQAGYLKPGVSQFVSSTVTLTDIVNNPANWTGKDNAADIGRFLNNAAAQQTAQQTVFNQAYSALTAQGLLPPNILSKDLSAVLNTAANFNVETASQWLQGQLSSEAQATINAVARAGEFAASISQVATLAGQGSLSSAVMLAGSALGLSGAGLSQATSALSLFETVYNSKSSLGQALRTGFGSYGQKLSAELGLGGELQAKISSLVDAPGQIIDKALSEFKNIGITIGSELSSAFQSLGGASSLADLSTAIGAGEVFDGFGALGDVFAGPTSSIFDITRVDALGNEYTINLFSELRLEGANFLDSAGQLFGIDNLGSSLFGDFGAISGISEVLGIAGSVIKVFNTFFGGGGGDGSGLNFTLDAVSRPVQAFQNTVNRSTVDAAVTRIIGTATVTDLSFGAVSNQILSQIRIDVTGIAAARSLIGTVQAQAARAQAQTAFVTGIA
jgi:hypothetical protein